MSHPADERGATPLLHNYYDFDMTTSVTARRELVDRLDGVGSAICEVLRRRNVSVGEYATWDYGGGVENLILSTRQHDASQVEVKLVRNLRETTSAIYMPTQQTLATIRDETASGDARMRFRSVTQSAEGVEVSSRPFYDPHEPNFSLEVDDEEFAQRVHYNVSTYFATFRTLFGALVELEDRNQPTRHHS